ncbi:MAG: BrnT family toxin [Rhizobiales bacterium]|nr:BrnT family toxin [Hyphomicrobiales bacterium]
MTKKDVLKWDPAKSEQLRKLRGLGFEEIEVAIEKQQVLANIASPSKRYPHQRMLVIWVNGYVHAVPYVEEKGVRFLKTIFPSRVLNKKYGGFKNGPQ